MPFADSEGRSHSIQASGGAIVACDQPLPLRRPDRQRHPVRRLISGLFCRPASLPDGDCRQHQARSSSPAAIAPWRSPERPGGDADPNQPITRWSRKSGCPEKLTVISGATESTLTDEIDDAARKTAFVIVDLEGTASHMVTLAMSRTDFAVIPTKGSELDAIEAIKIIKFIRVQERVFRRTIPYAVLFTQTNPAVRPRTLKSLEADMLQQGIPMFDTALNERDAFRAIFSYGGTLSGLDYECRRQHARCAL